MDRANRLFFLLSQSSGLSVPELFELRFFSGCSEWPETTPFAGHAAVKRFTPTLTRVFTLR
jgi:hypothetical protein